MSKSREMDTLADAATPEMLAAAAVAAGCRSIAYTYNDPVIFMEYAIDVAQAAREKGIDSVAVTAGYVCPRPREAFFRHMDGANIDLKAFTERFYHKICGGHLADVLDTLLYLKHETSVWFELTTLLIPGENDSDEEIEEMSCWIHDNLGDDIPHHFTAFHPDYRMRDTTSTPAATLTGAREIARKNGLSYVYTGNVHDSDGGSTWCPSCGELLIERDWYTLGKWHLDAQGCCAKCGQHIAGVFESAPGDWGAKRQPIRLSP
jgi:pyruvate formate lyase activating enzyme